MDQQSASPGGRTRTYVLGQVTIHVSLGQIATVVDHGIILGEPHATPDYLATTERLGYGTDTVRQNAEHEIGHSLLAYWLGLPQSPVFDRLAHGLTDATRATGLEEDAVMAIQRFARAMGVNLEDQLGAFAAPAEVAF